MCEFVYSLYSDDLTIKTIIFSLTINISGFIFIEINLDLDVHLKFCISVVTCGCYAVNILMIGCYAVYRWLLWVDLLLLCTF